MMAERVRLVVNTRLTWSIAVLVACGGSATPPVVPQDPTAVAVADATKSPPERAAALLSIRRHLIESGVATMTIDIAADGRVLRLDSVDRYEEEFYLSDVTEVVYVFMEDWDHPHIAEVRISDASRTRWRRGDEEWMISSIPTVTFVFTNKPAAEAVVAAFRVLVAGRSSWPN